MQGDVYRNNHTGIEYVVEVKDIMSHDTLVVFTDNKSGQRETFACEIKAFKEYATFVTTNWRRNER